MKREGFVLDKVKVFLEMVKFEHTIFALPYAYIGMVMASFYTTGGWPSWSQVLWITLAMVGARSAAMALNRVIDRVIDAKNPRTANREIPKGIVSVSEAVVFIVASFALLGVSSWMLTPLAFYLMPLAVAILVLYPYVKRFSWACHLVLGAADGLAPLGAWIAITGSFGMPGILLGLAVAAWIAGFDIIYGCQDVDFDRKEGVHSIPARFGIGRGLWISRGLDVLTIVFLLLIPFYIHLGVLYYVGVALVAVLLVIEHRLISPTNLSNINIAFFTVNSYVAMTIFVFTLGDIAWSIFAK